MGTSASDRHRKKAPPIPSGISNLASLALNAAVISDLLRDLGYETDEAGNGLQGVPLLEQRPYDLVITDLQMPQLTGWEVVNAVRGRRPTMPMIMISGFATEDDVEAGPAARGPAASQTVLGN